MSTSKRIVISVISVLAFIGVFVTLTGNDDQNGNEMATNNQVSQAEPRGSGGVEESGQETQVNPPEGWVEYRSDEYGFSFYHEMGARGPDLGLRAYSGGEEIYESSVYVETEKNAATFELFILNCTIEECVDSLDGRINEREERYRRLAEVDPIFNADRTIEMVVYTVVNGVETDSNYTSFLIESNGNTFLAASQIDQPEYETEKKVNDIISTLTFN